MQKIVLIVLLVPLVLVGCGPTSPEPATPSATPAAPGQPAQPGYPAPAQPGYPAPAQPGYPAPAGAGGYPVPQVEYPEGPEFRMNVPVRSSDTQVSGTGPAGVPINLINVEDNGTVIGQTTIAEDGTYTVDVTGNMGPSQMIAVTLGDISDTDLQRENFIQGPGYVELPFVGRIFTSTVVIE